MIEAIQKNEMINNELIINQSLNPNSFEFKGSMNTIKKGKWVERKPDYNGKKVFDYTDKNWWKWEIVIGKQNSNQYEFRIKKRENVDKTGEINRKTYLYKWFVNAKDLLEFNRELWAVLDETIWTVGEGKRINLANVWKKAFEDLNKTHKEVHKKPHAKIEWKANNVFDYTDDKWKWEIEICKQRDNQYEFIVKHLEKMEDYDEMVWATQCHKWYVNAKNLFEFNRNPFVFSMRSNWHDLS